MKPNIRLIPESFRGKRVQLLQPTIKDVFCKYVFEKFRTYNSEYLYAAEFKELLFNLSIKIEESSWEIPYLVLLTKRLNPKSRKANDFVFSKQRNINVPLFAIEDKEGISTLIDILQILDSEGGSSISEAQYDNESVSLFFSNTDIQNLTKPDELKYCIKKYYSVATNTNAFLKNDILWSAPTINICSIKTQTELSFPTKNRNGEIVSADTFNVVPYSYVPSFCDSFDRMKRRPNLLCDLQKRATMVFFKGTYEQCKEVLIDKKKLSAFLGEVLKEEEDARKKAIQENTSYNRRDLAQDYFDAMTDGQLGDYDDFKGSIDDIDTLSGR
jgi:hypothetical protein